MVNTEIKNYVREQVLHLKVDVRGENQRAGVDVKRVRSRGIYADAEPLDPRKRVEPVEMRRYTNLQIIRRRVLV